GSPPQARWSSRREEQQDTLVIGGAIKLLDKLGENGLVEDGQLAPSWPPEIPADQQRGDDCGQRGSILDLRSFHVSPGKHAGDHLREENDHKNDCGGNPQHGHAQRTASSALAAPAIQLNEPANQQSDRKTEKPATETLRPTTQPRQPHRANKAQWQAARQSRKSGYHGCDGSCSFRDPHA